MGLPSAQHVADAMGVTPLKDQDILIGKGVDTPAVGEKPVSISTISNVFAHNCPLWTYILAEAMAQQAKVKLPVKENITVTTPQLGKVGGRIVAEVFLGLMFGDNHSLLTSAPNWQPQGNPIYALKDFVKYALAAEVTPQALKQAV